MAKRTPHAEAGGRSSYALNRRRLLASAGAVAAGAAAAGVRSSEGSEANPQFVSRTLEGAPDAGAWIELDGRAVAANLDAVRAKVRGLPVMGVIKANGYGHGLLPIARLLSGAGVDALMVITVDEALALRDARIPTPVLNYGPFDRAAARELIARDIDQAVYTIEAVEGMAEAAERAGRPARVQVVIDSGLGRVGVPYRDAMSVFAAAREAARRGSLQVTGMMTALTEDPDYDRIQLERFLTIESSVRRAGIDTGFRHVASSAAVLDFPEAHLDMVRPGIMLYGHYPNDRSREERPIDLVPVLSLRAKVAIVKQVAAGDSIGYHRAWVAERDTLVATLPIGHSEGYPPGALPAGGHVEIHGRACHLVGGISANLIQVAIPDGVEVTVGDAATLIAGGATADMSSASAPLAPLVAGWGGTSEYGLLMRLNPLLPRVVVG